VPPSHVPFLDHSGVLAFAHRGGALEAAENTMAAFQRAVDLGYRYLETDVHVTRDGVLLAFHDDRLDRVTDRVGVIEDLDYAEVRHARIEGGETIPLLEDVIGTWPELRVNIDPKSYASIEPLAQVIERTAAIDRVCVGSFADRRIIRLQQRLGPRLCTSVGPVGVARLRARSLGVPFAGRGLDARCLQVPIKQSGIPVVDRAFVETAHRLGLQVHVWLVDDPDEMNALIDLNVDGLMTDRPSVLKDVLSARGLWV